MNEGTLYWIACYKQNFRVTPVDYEDLAVEKDTASGAWSEIFEKARKVCERDENAANDSSPAVDGLNSAKSTGEGSPSTGKCKGKGLKAGMHCFLSTRQKYWCFYVLVSIVGKQMTNILRWPNHRAGPKGMELFGLTNSTIFKLICKMDGIEEIRWPNGAFRPPSEEETKGLKWISEFDWYKWNAIYSMTSEKMISY